MGKKKASKPGDAAAKTAMTLRRRKAKAEKIARSLAKCASGKTKRAATLQRAANKAMATALKVARFELRRFAEFASQ